MMEWLSWFVQFAGHPVVVLLLSLLWKSSALMVGTALAVGLCSGCSASLRSWLWTLGLLGLLLLPLTELTPKWSLSLLPAEAPTRLAEQTPGGAIGSRDRPQDEGEPNVSEPGSRPRVRTGPETATATSKFLGSNARLFDWLPELLLLLWVGVGLVSLFGWVAAWRAGLRVIHSARPAPLRIGVLLEEMWSCSRLGGVAPRLYMTGQLESPAVTGILTPAILLPERCLRWSAEELQLVLRHEFEHVLRRDCLIQFGTRLACSLFWFNPLVWKANREMQREREKACDDAVLSSGVRPSLYAQSLLEVARSLNGRAAAQRAGLRGATIPMAQQSNLEDRLMSILDVTRTRARLSGWSRGASLFLAAMALAFLATLQIQLRAASTKPSLEAESAASPASAEMLQPASGAPAMREHTSSQRTRTTREGSERSFSYSRTDDDGHLQVVVDTAGYRLEVEAFGEIRISDDDRRIENLGRGGYLRIRESRRGQPDHRFEATDRDGSGTPEFRFFVGNKPRPYEGEGSQWLGEVLVDILRRSGVAATERVARMLSRGGPGEVLNEIREIPSDGIKVVYFQELAEQGELTDQQWIDFFDLTGRAIESDGDKTRLLISTLRAVTRREQLVHEGWFDALRSVSSDGDKARAMIAALDQVQLNPSIAPQFYAVARTISSDGDKARVLLRWIGQLPEVPLGSLFFDVAEAIESDGDLTRVLLAAIRAGGSKTDPADSLRLLQAARSIDSDGDLSRLLIGALGSGLQPDALRELLATARTIGSDGDKARVLLTLASNYELAGSLRDEFVKVADTIHSDGEHRRVMRQIR